MMPFQPFENPAVGSRSLRFVLAISRFAVLLLILSGGGAVLGWITGVGALSAPLAGWPAMLPITGLCSIAVGVAVWGRIEARTSVALFGAGFALTASIISVAGLSLGWPVMPLPSALLVATAAVGLLGGALQARPDVEKLTLGLAGLGLVALAVTTMFARAIGVFGRGTGDHPTGSSAQLVATMFLLGVCYIALVWRSGFEELEPPAWLPAAAGLLGLVTVIVLWHALALREYEEGRERTRQAAAGEARLIRREFTATARALGRAAEGAVSGVSLEEQLAQLEALRRDLPSLQAALRLNDDGTPLLLIPPSTAVEPVTASWRKYLADNVLRSDSMAYLPLDPGVRTFVIFAPICRDRCDGAIAAVIHSATLFESTLTDTLRDFRFSIAGADGPLLGAGPPHDLPPASVQTSLLTLGGVSWILSAWPAADVAAGASDLPGTVLFMGLVVALLLPVTLQLGRSAWEGARERERARIAFALDSATDGLWELHLDGEPIRRTPSLARQLLHPADGAHPSLQPWTALVHADDLDRVEESLRRHLAGDTESFEAEYRVRAGDGTWHAVMDRGRVVDRSPAGTPTRVLGISADVTRSRAVAQAREESERRFRALFNSGFQFQLLLDREFQVLEVNQTTLAQAGLPLEEVLGRACWDTLWWAGQPAAQQVLRQACASADSGQTEVWEQEIRVTGNPVIVLEMSLKPIDQDHGRPRQFLLEGRDITARRRAEAGLKELDTLTTMGRVAARVAHEINNPLAGIQSAFLLIKDAVPNDHPHFAYVGSIEREIERIARVTRQLYETYRPEQDTGGLSSVPLVVHDAVAFLEQVNRSRDVRIHCDLERVPQPIAVPAAILRHIVYNLVQNAIDASPSGGVVQVTAEASQGHFTLRVLDQGPGVPPELREQIFDPFFTTKEREMTTSGMGLGLALVRRTVAAAGGTIVVESGADGGAVFVVRLPLDLPPRGGAA